VTRYHDADAAVAARNGFDRVHRAKQTPEEMETVRLAPGEDGSLWVAYVLVGGGLADSTSEARRLIAQGGVRVDGETLTDSGCHLPRGSYVVQRGKRRFVRVEIGDEGSRPAGDGQGDDGG
jgi:tyrosyl-tRNA synthetase